MDMIVLPRWEKGGEERELGRPSYLLMSRIYIFGQGWPVAEPTDFHRYSLLISIKEAGIYSAWQSLAFLIYTATPVVKALAVTVI